MNPSSPSFTQTYTPTFMHTHKKQHLLAAWVMALSAATTASHAAPDDAAAAPLADQGFSYFMGLGQQSIRYQEFGSLLPFKSEAKTNSPLLITGALYAVNPNLYISLGSETTYFAGSTRETWNATSPTFNGTTLTSPLLQTNNFSLNHTDTQILGHYRVQQNWFALAGASARSLSFKRNSFSLGPDRAVNTPATTTVEESAAELLLSFGAALESTRVRGVANHYSLRAVVGVPIARRVENTASPAVRFTGTKGFDASLEGRYSWALLPNVHVGAWGRFNINQRSAQNSSSGGVQYELPRSRLESLGYGVELLWKL